MRSLESILQDRIKKFKEDKSGGMNDYFRELLESVLAEYYIQLEKPETKVDENYINYPFM